MSSPRQNLSAAKQQLLDRWLNTGIAPAKEARGIVKRQSTADAPLSLPQQQVWRQALTAAGKPQLYNESITMRRNGSLEPVPLAAALTEIVRRHEIWRTTYRTVNGTPLQHIRPACDFMDLPSIDLSQLPIGEARSRAVAVASEDAAKPFDLEHGPLIRALLIHLPADEHHLVLTMHQSVVDGVSVYQIIPSELIALYNVFLAGAEPLLPPLEIQYSDYAAWQRDALTNSVLTEQAAYWTSQLKGAPGDLPWPNDFDRPPEQTHRGVIMPCHFDATLLDAVLWLCRAHACTLFTALFCAMAAVLLCYTGRADILIGTLAPAGRKHSEVKNLIGYFLNPVALRSRAEPSTAFSAMIDDAKQTIAGALSNDDVLLEHVAQAMQMRPDPSRHLYFQVAVTLAPPLAELEPGWSQSFMDADSGGARWDLYLEFSRRSDGLMGRIQYNPDLFRRATIDLLLADIQAVLRAAASDPAIPLKMLPVKNACGGVWNGDTR
jgi:hypothetical protein